MLLASSGLLKSCEERQLIIWLDRLDVHEKLAFLNITVRLDEYIWDKSNGLFATKDDTARLWFTVARVDNILIDNLILVCMRNRSISRPPLKQGRAFIKLSISGTSCFAGPKKKKETKNKLGEAEGSRLLCPFKLSQKDKHGDDEKRDMVSSGH